MVDQGGIIPRFGIYEIDPKSRLQWSSHDETDTAWFRAGIAVEWTYINSFLETREYVDDNKVRHTLIGNNKRGFENTKELYELVLKILDKKE